MYKTLMATSIVALLSTVPALAQTKDGQAPGTTSEPRASAPSSTGKQDAPSIQKGAQGSEKGTASEKQKTTESDRDRKAADTRDEPRSGKSADKDDGKADAKDQKSASDKADDKTKARAGKDGTAATGAGAGGSGKTAITTEQRDKVKTVFAKHKSKAQANIQIDVNVGTTVPKNVTLVEIPQDILVIVPQYREYKYFVIEEKVVIVDPDTYEVVEIIVIA
jgi:hypothetical protein